MNFEEIKENFKENPVRYIKNLAMDFVVVLVGLAYIFYQMLTLKPSDLNPLVLLAEAVMSIICGVVIKQALGENGFSKGYNSESWTREEALYNDACNTANPYMERVDNFYLCEEIDKRRTYRRQHLLAVRLRYDSWFDYDGNYIGTEKEFKNLTFRQKRVLNKCIKVKIYVLNLFSEYSTATEEYTHRERTDNMQKAINLGKNTVAAVFVAIIGVYFVPLLQEWSWAKFIFATMQVALWVILGVLQLYNNYDYVVHTKVAKLRKKKETIKRFTTGCEKDLYKDNPYDEIRQKMSLTAD